MLFALVRGHRRGLCRVEVGVVAVLMLFALVSARAGVPLGFDAARTIVAVPPTAPVVQLRVTSPAGVGCYAIEERVAGALTPSEIDQGGVWLPARHVIRWGPIFQPGAGMMVFSYRVNGPAGPAPQPLIATINGDGAWVLNSFTEVALTDPAGEPQPPPPAAAPPTFSPPAGAPPVDVTITTTMPGVTIRYTTDGTVPNGTSATYAGPLHLTAETVLRARAFKTGLLPSVARNVFYSTPANVPTLNVAGSIDAADPIAPIVRATAGAAIRFTTDGTAPGETSAIYSGPVHLIGETMLRARGFKSGMSPSPAGAALFQQVDFGAALSVVRTVSGSGGVLPAVTLNATPSAGLASFTVTEELPPGLQPYDIDVGGVWTASKRTVKWGPFAGASAVSLHYHVSGESGSYTLDGDASRDGRPQAITGAQTVVVDLSTIQQVAPPLFSPPATGIFPVDVTITCATPGATIRYTIDGPAADESSPIYTGPLHLITAATVRAKAFKQFMAPSAAVTRRYGEDMLPAGTIILRTISGNNTTTPDVRLAVTPVASARSYTITEKLPSGLAAQGISHGGKFNAASRKVKWGPFMDHSPRTLTYSVGGPNGEYTLAGSGSFNGFAVETDGAVYLTVVSSALLDHGVTGNWTFSPQVALTVSPVNLGGGDFGEPVRTYAVEEFLPTGVTPTAIDGGGVWNANLRTIKWGPFQDAQVRTFHYQPTGAHRVFETSSRLSVDGVSVLSIGEVPVILGLPAPAPLLAAGGNQSVFLAWTPTGHEAGYKVSFRTQSAPLPEQVVNIGAVPSGNYSLTGLVNGTPYWIQMTAYDAAGVESARSVTVLATPSAGAGTWGTIAFNQANYPNTGSQAVVMVWDADLNTNPATQQSVSVQVLSDTDAAGVPLLLRETGPNTGVFTSLAAGTNLGFTFGASVPASGLLRVREGDAVHAIYNDALPTGTRLAYAQFAEFDSDGDGIPDWWEREHFGSYTVAGANTDHDSDGVLDGAEFLAGTNPNDPSSAFKIVSVARTLDGRITLRWASVAGTTYTVEKSSGLSGFYEVIAGLPSTGAVTEYIDANPAGTLRIFYRVQVDP